MKERLSFEREIGLLRSGDDSEGRSEFESSSPARRAPAKPLVDPSTATQVMWEIIRIINRQKDVNEADPDKARSPPAWHLLYAPVLKQWFVLTYGELSGTRKRPQGDALRTKVDEAFAATQPILDMSKKSGGAKWSEQLRQFFYPKIAAFEVEAILSGPVRSAARTIQVTFPERPPRPVSLNEFFSVVATREGKPIEIQRGIGGYSLGNAKAGDVFRTSQQEQRILLWSDGGAAVFFQRDGVIYAQSGKGFSEDIIFGAFVLAAQNASGSAMLAQLMVDIGLSFTPWGALWDGVSALKALTEHDWKGAALALLPAPALKLASKTRAFRAAARGAAVTGTVAAQIAKGAVRFVGRGAYWLKGKWLRGIWVVGETAGAGGRHSYRFFDDVGEQWHDVEEAVGKDYIKCSVCSYTTRGKTAALIGEVDEVFSDLMRSPVYASRGRVLIPRKLVKDVMEAFGPWGDYVVECILDASSHAPNAVKLAEDTLTIAKDLSRIKGVHGYQDLVDIFEDLASSSKYTPRGAMYELEWAAKHVDEIEAMGVPSYSAGWKGYGKGLDILKKNGAAIELKNFDFTSRFYKDDPGRAVARIANQAKRRLDFSRPKVSSVTILFDSRTGLMPPAFEAELKAALSDLAKRYGVGKSKVTFGFWP